ncbi:YeiH family protein [Streptomyces hoynatensis]|uniref:Putative sulfate exporter family transporter n=1 Tax=Streptomyces hoynatensis TaxID=1141874 RepID=A0A3A9Z6X6_9ACTN|nr:putative sulfate exporter family transporter [Streptomyces hoynatensis]RKN43980.1 putative sulfate exporter family transporter [Streptomyces hoynatensis]
MDATAGGRRRVPGLLLAAALAAPAVGLGELAPVVGGPVCGLLLGAAPGAALRLRRPAAYARCLPGLTTAGKGVLQSAIVLLGLALPLGRVLDAGARSLPVLLSTLGVALAGAWWLGGRLRLHPETRVLIGAGTGICGASAIAAVASVIRPARERTAYALGTIFTFNLVAVLTYPALGRLLGLTEHGFGLWAGTAVNDTSSVIAAASAFGSGAVALAVVVKLGRTLMIVPLCLALHLWRRPGRPAGERRGAAGALLGAFPPFILCFLAASALAAAGTVPGGRAQVTALSSALVTVALAGIGATLDPGAIRAAGPRPLAFGGALGAAVAVSALAVQALTGQT